MSGINVRPHSPKGCLGKNEQFVLFEAQELFEAKEQGHIFVYFINKSIYDFY